MKWITDWRREGRELEAESLATRQEIARLLAEIWDMRLDVTRRQVAEQIAQAIEARQSVGLPISRIAELKSPFEAYSDAAHIARAIGRGETL